VAASHRIVELGASEVDRVAHLFRELVAFHRAAVEGAWPVRGEEDAWAIRREQYLAWLGAGRARMLAAVRAGAAGAPADGYAVLSTQPSSASWDLGERIGELETLAVAVDARGEGIGTMLMEACEERLRAEGIAYWGVAVVEGNEGATRFYERAGFRPYYRNLMAPL
jgi:ribosomal protein S18 acetylase RimI-like enzyme